MDLSIYKQKHTLRILLLVTLILCLAGNSAYAGTAEEITAAASHTKAQIKFSNLSSSTVIEPHRHLRLKCTVIDQNSGKKLARKVRFHSSNRKVATITSKGVIHTKKNGTVTITAKTSTTKKSVRIRVGTRVKSITLKGDRYFTAGKSSKLKVTVKPARATNPRITWRSSDPSIATVTQGGTVKGLRPGTVTVTATAKDGSGVKKKVNVVIFQFSRDEMNWAGHRGMRGKKAVEQVPENTAAAFNLAGEYGLWGCDCDIWETKHTAKGNFEIVINHDPTFQRVHMVNKKVKDMTAKQIRNESDLSTVCFFDEYLGICAAYGMVPLVEMKDPDMTTEGIHRFIDMLAEGIEWDGPEDAFIFSSYSNELKEARKYCIKKYGFEPITMFEVGLSRQSMLQNMNYFVEQGFTGICLSKKLLSDSVADFCRDHGLQVCLFSYYDTVTDNTIAYRQIKNHNDIIDAMIMEEMLF